jgi:SAM-dependent methyltransferase
MDRQADRMKRFWDDRARENAAWYVDTSLDYDDPDMDRFFETGRIVVREALLEAPVAPERHEVAVEIGPGIGRISAALAEHFDRVIGIDVSEEMVAKARALVDNERVELRVGDGVSLQPVADDSVDFVTTFTVLQHMPSQELVLGYLADAARILRPGGVLAAQWNNLPHPRAWRWQARWWRLRSKLRPGGKGEQRNAPEFIGTRVPWPDVQRTLEGAGLEIVGRKGEDTLFSWVWARK